MQNNSKQNILKIGISFLIIFTIFFLIAQYPQLISLELKKAEVPIIFYSKNYSIKTEITGDSAITMKDNSAIDTIKSKIKNLTNTPFLNDTAREIISGADTSYKEKILLVGDSQLEGLRNPIYEYCVGNNCNLNATILWYGSSTKQWAQTDTLDYYIEKYKPTFVLFVIGLNELFVNDLENRKMYANKILAKFKNHNVKYCWIGPAAWTKDKGVIEIMKTQVGKLFYPSHILTLGRSDDQRHPSRSAAKIWADSVASFITKNAGVDFTKKTIAKPIGKNSPMIILSQVKN
jgi:hypothetical protein